MSKDGRLFLNFRPSNPVHLIMSGTVSLDSVPSVSGYLRVVQTGSQRQGVVRRL